MPTKSLDRLIFTQGGLCFFCKETLPKGEESVEHLVAKANGGSNNDENCVVCCKAVNHLFGSMSLKEKVQVILNQRGQFKCPADKVKAEITPKVAAKQHSSAQNQDEKLTLVLANLQQRGKAKPRTMKTLRSTISALFGKKLTEQELDSLIHGLLSAGTVIVDGKKLSYSL